MTWSRKGSVPGNHKGPTTALCVEGEVARGCSCDDHCVEVGARCRCEERGRFASADASFSLIEHFWPRRRLAHSPQNLGFSCRLGVASIWLFMTLTRSALVALGSKCSDIAVAMSTRSSRLLLDNAPVKISLGFRAARTACLSASFAAFHACASSFCLFFSACSADCSSHNASPALDVRHLAPVCTFDPLSLRLLRKLSCFCKSLMWARANSQCV